MQLSEIAGGKRSSVSTRALLVTIAAVFVMSGLAAWFAGSRLLGWSEVRLLVVELSLTVVLLLIALCVLLVERPQSGLSADAGMSDEAVGQGDGEEGVSGFRPAAARSLASLLRERDGWFWRYRSRWVLVAGDEALTRRVAPGLAEMGYAISGDVVLLYAKQNGETLDTVWLDQIRRLRPRRPVDAIVAIVRSRAGGRQPFDADQLTQRLAHHARMLRWAAPLYVLNATEFGSHVPNPDEAIGRAWTNPRAQRTRLETSLHEFAGELGDLGVARLAKDLTDRYLAELSKHVGTHSTALAGLIAQFGQSSVWRDAVYGVFFTPLFQERLLPDPDAAHERSTGVAGGWRESASQEADDAVGDYRWTLWQAVAGHSRNLHGRRVGFSLSTTAAWSGVALVALWTTSMMVSGFANRSAIATASQTLAKLGSTPDPTRSAQTLDALDAQLDTLEFRQRNGTPWHMRFGLNHNAALYAALWPAYENASARILVAPIRVRLEDRLRQLASLSDAEIASGGADQVKAAYATLKTYLMLAKPEHADAAFLTQQLLDTMSPVRPAGSPLTGGAWLDLRRRLVTFFAAHLGRRVDGTALPPVIVADTSLVAGTRQTVISVFGLQNSTDAVYQRILDEARPKYPPLTLAALLGDTGSRGLFSTTATVLGAFTREAWDERIAKALDEAAQQRSVTGDWVLSDAVAANKPTSTLRDELRHRYFDDYARAWEQFLNTVRWQAAPNLSGTVDQLTLLSDPQRSPLVALMKAVVWQAGSGAATQSLSDSLINKARQLTGTDEKNPSKIASGQPDAPLAAAFGPILRFAGSETTAGNKANAQMAATGDLSLPRYIERVSAMRLKLQQIVLAPDPNATSRVAAQAVLQGRTSDIAESRDYGSRVAASLGQQWAGFGGLFEAPLDQTWQMVLQPAAASLNETWRTAIVADWDRAFGGRYPFADSDNDASLPEMARFMRPDTGMIAQFMNSQLAGVVERQGDRWVPVQDTSHGNLKIDPAFLASINRLMRVSTVLFPSGDARIRFDLRGVPAPGITDVRFVLAGRQFEYFNQKEEWVSFVWPDDTLDSRSRIEWQTAEGGLRSALDAQGRFGPIRLFEKAKVAQQDTARYLLTWAPDQGSRVALRTQLRSEAGSGPLEVLALRHYRLPAQIFVVNAGKVKAGTVPSGPPPLPPAALEAGRHAEITLPGGMAPEVR